MPNRLAPFLLGLTWAEQQATVYCQETSSLTLSLLPTAPRWARQHAADMLRRWNLTDAVEWAVCQVVSELVTNAVAAALDDGAERVRIVRLTLRLLPRRLYVEVFDAVPRLPEACDPSDEAETGRGLRIVATLADAVEVRRERTGGKTVSAAFDLPSPSGAADGSERLLPDAVPLNGEPVALAF